MVILQTPGTGYPDLEARIAFGLAWVARQVEGLEVTLRRTPGAYQCVLGTGHEEEKEGSGAGPSIAGQLQEAFRWTASRYLAAETLYQLPGIQARYRENYRSVEGQRAQRRLKEEFESADLTRLYQPRSPAAALRQPRKGLMCGHEGPAFGGSQGLILGLSSHAGKPYERDFGGARFNLGLCSICGSLAVLGHSWATFRCVMGPQNRPNAQATLLLTPLPAKVGLEGLEALFAAQKESDGANLGPAIPTALVPLVFLSRFPFTAYLLAEAGAELHVTRFDPVPPPRGGERLGNQVTVDVRGFARFVWESPFNSATVTNLVRRDAAGVEALQQLARVLSKGEKRDRQRSLARFAREHHVAAGRLVYPQTLEVLEGECEMSAEVIQNGALKRLAAILRFFGRQGKYTYIDSVRTAREPKHLREILSQVNRVLDPAYKEWKRESSSWVSLPPEERQRRLHEWAKRYGGAIPPRPLSQDELDTIWRLIDSDLREEMKQYVAAAALTWPRREQAQAAGVTDEGGLAVEEGWEARSEGEPADEAAHEGPVAEGDRHHEAAQAAEAAEVAATSEDESSKDLE